MLIAEGDTHVCKENKIPEKMQQGDVEYFGVRPKLFKVPSKVHPFLFRNKDMYDVLTMLQTDGVKIVQVFALPGLGKSSMIRNITNHLAERSIYKGGILYLNVSKIESLSEALLMIKSHLEQAFSYDNVSVLP